MTTFKFICFTVLMLCIQTVEASYVEWFEQPSDIHVEVITREDGTLGFLVNINSTSISSFHVKSALTGNQYYDTDIVGWTYRPEFGQPFVITSYENQGWTFHANSGDFWWQAVENVTNLGQPGYDLFFRVRNANFSTSTQFVYSFDRISDVPVPATFWLFGSGLIGLIVKRKNAGLATL